MVTRHISATSGTVSESAEGCQLNVRHALKVVRLFHQINDRIQWMSAFVSGTSFGSDQGSERLDRNLYFILNFLERFQRQ